MILFEFWLFCKVSLKLISINWKEISDNLFLPRGYFMQFNTGQTEQQYVGFKAARSAGSENISKFSENVSTNCFFLSFLLNNFKKFIKSKIILGKNWLGKVTLRVLRNNFKA